jgi:phosphohistidine phosphatase
MELLMVRHAIAEDRVAFARTGKSDYHRPLTEKGRSRMIRGAAGLHAVVPRIDVLASSPLTRATETAEIVAAEYGLTDFERVDAIGTGDGDALLRWLRGLGPSSTVAVVGHEPHMSDWAGWFLTGSWADFLIVKKGSAVMLEFPGAIEPGEAYLRWALTPGQLRRLGGEE